MQQQLWKQIQQQRHQFLMQKHNIRKLSSQQYALYNISVCPHTE